MTENLDWFSHKDEDEQQDGSSTLSEQLVRLELPPELALALQHYSQQSGQTQTEVISALLQSASRLTSVSTPAGTSGQFNNVETSTAEQQKWQSIETRLTQLEALIPRLEILEGKSRAF